MQINATQNILKDTAQVSILVPGRWHTFDYARELDKRGQLRQLITTYPRFEIVKYGVPATAIVSLWWLEVLRRASFRVIPKLPAKMVAKWQDKVNLAVLRLFAQQAAARLSPCDVVVAWSGIGTPAFRKAQNWQPTHRPTLRVCERLSSHIRAQEAILIEEHELQGLPWRAWDQRQVRLELDDYQCADVVATPSLFATQTFVQQGFPDNRLIQVTHGTDLATFHPPETPIANQDRDNDNGGGKFRAIYAGSLTLRKGIGYLVQGFLQANLPNSELWLIGSKAAETDRLIGPADPRVQLRGHFPQAELHNLYNQASVFVMASIEDGFGYVLAEALACGLPLICTTNTGGPDLLKIGLSPGQTPLQLAEGIQQYPAGFVVPIRRPGCIAACLRKLQDDPSLRQAMRAAAADSRDARFGYGQQGDRPGDNGQDYGHDQQRNRPGNVRN